MIPLERVKQIIDTYETLEKSLSSGDIDKKDFVKKSKEYSSIGEVISEARGYVGLAKEKKDLEKIINEKGNDKEMIKLAEKEIADLLEPLGFYNKRAKTLQRMSEGYLKGFTDVIELYGVGQYAKDSWELFQNNNRNINPTDKVLTEYLRIT